MSIGLQYGIVFLAVAAAAWAAWRILRGRRVFGRGAKSAQGGCAGCDVAAEHHKRH